MPAYWIAHVTVTDPERYAGYQTLAPQAFAAHGAVFLARGGESHSLEGELFERHIVIRFPDIATALACYDSAEYVAARKARAGACRAQVIIIDGLSA